LTVKKKGGAGATKHKTESIKGKKGRPPVRLQNGGNEGHTRRNRDGRIIREKCRRRNRTTTRDKKRYGKLRKH